MGESLVRHLLASGCPCSMSLRVKGKLTIHSHKDFTEISPKRLTSKKHILISKKYRKPPLNFNCWSVTLELAISLLTDLLNSWIVSH